MTEPVSPPAPPPDGGGPAPIGAICRACAAPARTEATRCPACGRASVLAHPELAELSIAHLDCDAFYAAIEKRDDPSLADKPVIIGGGARGVVATACYIARTYGVRSAMPMFKALKACPDAVVVRPDFEKYAAAGRAIREKMRMLTPLVEPLSIDEAFMDLHGTARLHGAPPAIMLARLQNTILEEIGITVSIGLSHNKFLAKIASDLDKPRGFSVIGRAETRQFLSGLPIEAVWGVGAATARRLRADGYATLGDLQGADQRKLADRYGDFGLKLWRLSRGEDARPVRASRETKSVSAERTFSDDVADLETLEDRLWPLCEKVAARMREKGLQGRVLTLKLKTRDFQSFTRRASLAQPSRLARVAFAHGRRLLAEAIAEAPRGRTAYRLIGVGFSQLSPAGTASAFDLFEADASRLERQEDAIDAIRTKFGAEAINAGRALKSRR